MSELVNRNILQYKKNSNIYYKIDIKICILNLSRAMRKLAHFVFQLRNISWLSIHPSQ